MVGRVMGLMMLGCVLGSTGCRKAERTPVAEQPEVVATQTKAVPTTDMVRAPPPVAIEAMPEAAPVRTSAPAEASGPIVLQESATRTRQQMGSPAPAQGRQTADDADRIWLSESAEAARAGNVNIDADEDTDTITIASGTVDGRVKRVRGRTIEVSDGEGNIYELRIDRQSRGLRQGRKVSLKNIAEGTPVRASFDLVGGGDTLARDIVLRR